MHTARALRLLLLVLAALVMAAAPARADEPPAPEGSPAGAPMSAWELYDAAFVRLAAADVRGARALLVRLQREFPSHPAALQAADRLGELGPEPAEPARAQPTDRDPTQRGRAEMALGLTAHSLWLGINVCHRFDCSGVRSNAAMLMLSGSSGLGLSLLATRGGVPSAQARLVNSALLWGAWSSLWLVEHVREGDGYGYISRETAGNVRLAAHLGGLGVGLGLWPLWRPTSGQVALANSGGIWTTVLTVLGYGAATRELTGPLGITMAGNAGLVLGGLLGQLVPEISHGRVLLIDAGGILGLLGGGLVAAASSARDDRAILTPMLLGTAAGLGVAAYATRHWDVHAPAGARVSVMPMGQEGWGASLLLDWH